MVSGPRLPASSARRLSTARSRVSLPLAASTAKAYAGDAGWRVPDASIQVHGGIGFTWEHDLHFFLKRGRSNAAIFGDDPAGAVKDGQTRMRDIIDAAK